MNRIAQTVPYQVDTGFSPYAVGELETALADLERFGFTGVEFAVAYPDRVDPEEMLRKVSAHRLAVTTLSTGQIYGLEGLYLSSPDRAVRERAQRVIWDHIDLSARIGRPPVTVGLIRGKGEDGERTRLMELFRDSMLRIADHAAKRAVPVQVECICRAETALLNTTGEGLAFLESLGDPPEIGLLYDTYHSYFEDGDMLRAISAAAGRIFNVHLADSNRGLPGTGEIDFAAVVRAIRETGYRGAFALETKMVPDRAAVLANYAKSMHNIS